MHQHGTSTQYSRHSSRTAQTTTVWPPPPLLQWHQGWMLSYLPMFPPSLNFFRSLPDKPEGTHLGVYALTMEKEGEKPGLYIGSGTEVVYGVRQRINIYSGEGRLLPRFVKLRLGQGYQITHVGLLCWFPSPAASLVPRVRAQVLLLEAAFAIAFHAAFAAITDQGISHLLLWPRKMVDWAPLCSHLPLTEAIRGNLELSPEELEIVAALRAVRLAETALEASRRHRARKRAGDPIGYLQRTSAQRQAWAVKINERVKKTATRVRVKTLESDRFWCKDCELSLQSKDALERHQRTKAHRDRLAGIAKSAPSKSAVLVAAGRVLAKASKAHHCSTCDKSFNNDWSLNRHLQNPSHLKKTPNSSH